MLVAVGRRRSRSVGAGSARGGNGGVAQRRGGRAGPDDLAVAPFPTGDVVLLVGRDGHPFRRRERRQLLALARIADASPAVDRATRSSPA